MSLRSLRACLSALRWVFDPDPSRVYPTLHPDSLARGQVRFVRFAVKPTNQLLLSRKHTLGLRRPLVILSVLGTTILPAQIVVAQPTPAPSTSGSAAAPSAPPPAPPPTPAEPSSADQYKQHMSNGVKLFNDENFGAAIAEFEAAYAERPRASPLVNLALCHKSLFHYPKAITALEKALALHHDSMEAEDRAAAETAIREMRALLGYVTVEVSPPHAVLYVDNEPLPAGAKDKPLALGPGKHRLEARAEGYESANELVTVTSADRDKVVKFALVPNMGWVVVKTDDPEMAIAIDQQPMALGEWAGLVEPGTHLVQMYKPGGAEYAFQVLVVAGKAQEVRPDVGGVPIALSKAATAQTKKKTVIAPAKIAKPPAPPQKGIYGQATAGAFLMFGEEGGGGMFGMRLGYRSSSRIGFEFIFDYMNNRVFTEAPPENDKVVLSITRLGGGLRLMSPGRTLRFVATIDGGLAYKWIGAGKSPGAVPFMNLDLGMEYDWSGVLLGVAAQQNVFLASDNVNARELSDPRFTLGLGVRIGYAGW
jgi:hypothetical protein